MCGRFANHLTDMKRWVDLLGDWPKQAPVGYNIAPTMQVPLLTQAGCESMSWGLVPAWSKEVKPKYTTFNARTESVAQKPAFRAAWAKKRTCMIPMRGYYEWRTEGSVKQPYFVSHPEQPLWVAGLWEAREGAVSFTVLTRAADESLASLHSRQPCFLTSEGVSNWLEGEMGAVFERGQDCDGVSQYLRYYAVGREVNRVTHSGAGLIRPLKAAECPPCSQQELKLDDEFGA